MIFLNICECVRATCTSINFILRILNLKQVIIMNSTHFFLVIYQTRQPMMLMCSEIFKSPINWINNIIVTSFVLKMISFTSWKWFLLLSFSFSNLVGWVFMMNNNDGWWRCLTNISKNNSKKKNNNNVF